MTDRKEYLVKVDARQYSIRLSVVEREKLIRHYHGFVSVTEVVTLDFRAIADELGSEK